MTKETTTPLNPFSLSPKHYYIKIGNGANRPIYKEFFREILSKYSIIAKNLRRPIFYWRYDDIEKELDYGYKRAKAAIDYFCDDLQVIKKISVKEAQEILKNSNLYDNKKTTKAKIKEDGTRIKDNTNWYLILWEKLLDDAFIELITPDGDDKLRKEIKDYFQYLKDLPESSKQEQEQEKQPNNVNGRPPITAPMKVRKDWLRNEIRRVNARNKYDPDMCNAFYLYWSEPDDDEKFMRFEKEVSFHTARRLALWYYNESKRWK